MCMEVVDAPRSASGRSPTHIFCICFIDWTVHSLMGLFVRRGPPPSTPTFSVGPGPSGIQPLKTWPLLILLGARPLLLSMYLRVCGGFLFRWERNGHWDRCGRCGRSGNVCLCVYPALHQNGRKEMVCPSITSLWAYLNWPPTHIHTCVPFDEGIKKAQSDSCHFLSVACNSKRRRGEDEGGWEGRCSWFQGAPPLACSGSCKPWLSVSPFHIFEETVPDRAGLKLGAWVFMLY